MSGLSSLTEASPTVPTLGQPSCYRPQLHFGQSLRRLSPRLRHLSNTPIGIVACDRGGERGSRPELLFRCQVGGGGVSLRLASSYFRIGPGVSWRRRLGLGGRGTGGFLGLLRFLQASSGRAWRMVWISEKVTGSRLYWGSQSTARLLSAVSRNWKSAEVTLGSSRRSL